MTSPSSAHRPAVPVEIGLHPALPGETGAAPDAARTSVAEPPYGRVDRSQRMPHLFGQPADALSRLGSLVVAVVGVGSVGWGAVLHLARLGVGGLLLIDPGRTKPESILTHPLGPDEIGRPKASTLARLVKRLSPDTRVRAFDGPVGDLGPAALADVDAVLMATDRLGVEVELGQRCLELGLPLIQAAVHGESLVAQLRSFTNIDPEGPCPACAFGAAEWEQVGAETVYSCVDGVGARGRPAPGPPTTSVSPLCALAADLMVLELVRCTLGLTEPAIDRHVELRGFTLDAVTTPLARNPDCAAEHVRWRRAELLRPLDELTLGELLDACGDGADAVQVEGHAFVAQASCRCPEPSPVGRFVPDGVPLDGCPTCGTVRAAGPAHTHRQAPRRLLLPLRRARLADLGVTGAPTALVRHGAEVWLLTTPDGSTRGTGDIPPEETGTHDPDGEHGTPDGEHETEVAA